MAVPRRPRAAPTWRDIYNYIYLLYRYKVFFVLPYMGRVIPLETVGYYIPDSFISLSPCGTKIYVLLTLQATWRDDGRWISRTGDRQASIAWSADHGRSINTCLFKSSYNGPIGCNVATSRALIAWNADHQNASTHVLNRKRYNGPD